ncbi:MAG: glycine cleavage system protein GcvH [Microbacteriaceae bacterium]|jgi:glycine cleavage system H protein|nr:glycine cleavage system protein GcvH [Microbacteriaceae bacterium]HOA86048.1 glycine cleavage system protein GcvH [Microbacteriaceae bacterium]HPZ33664.1 glycine cleavage system protein GcvH [Microbacteriaceae bacterium]HQC93822.1 glycine cleavage system protein GcvH [Microbacteriaceae bacterium]
MTDLNALHFTPEHEWISIDGDVATIGITDYAAEQLGDVVFVELPDIDSGVTAGQVVGEIESTKSVGELFAPMDGDIVGVNEAVVDDPSLVNSAPFEAGWLIKVRVATGELPAGLLDRAAYVALTGGAQ